MQEEFDADGFVEHVLSDPNLSSKVVALKSLLADRLSALEKVAAQQRILQRAHEVLLAEHSAPAEDHTVLCECAHAAGMISFAQLQAGRRAHRCSNLLREALQVPGLAHNVGCMAGLRATQELASVSRAHGDGTRRALPTLYMQMPPQVYICGGSALVHGSAQGIEVATVERYNLVTGNWETLPPMPTARRWCGAASARGMPYVFGGHDGTQYLGVAERLNLSTGMWEMLPPMPTPREGCSVVAADGALYIFGGSHGEQALSAAERFDPATFSWEVLPLMPRARDACAAAGAFGMVFLFGGRESGNFLKTVDQFDPRSRRWLSLPPMLTARLGCSATATGGNLYVVGGHGHGQALSTLERYDLAGGFWEKLAPMPTARLGCVAIAAQNRLYVFCGHDGSEALSTAECFDPVTGTWMELAARPSARYACSGTIASV